MGNFTSGIINVVTKEGGSEYFGAIDLVTDNLGGDWVGTTKFDYNVYDISLGTSPAAFLSRADEKGGGGDDIEDGCAGSRRPRWAEVE